MITTQELRTCNCLLYQNIDLPEGAICRIDWQDLKWLEENPNEFNECHKPIRLMPELLEKIGFEKVNKSEYWLNYQAHNKAFLSLCLQDDSGGNYKKGVWYFTAADIELSYLHELQNAWFVFFKKELEINFD